MAKERILMVKILEKTHKELMRLKYDLKEVKSASQTIQFLIDFHKKRWNYKKHLKSKLES